MKELNAEAASILMCADEREALKFVNVAEVASAGTSQ